MKSKRVRPPSFANRFLLTFLREDIREEVLGDLEEKFYQTLEKKSTFRANINYIYQVFQYLRPFAVRKSAPRSLTTIAMYRSYFKIGWRNLLKNKGYSAINVGGLALAMTVTILIGLWIYDELTFNRYHDNYDTIAKVYRTEAWNAETQTNTAHVTGLGTLLQTEYGAHFKNVVMVRARLEDRVLTANEQKFTQPGYFMQQGGGEMLSLKMKYGKRNGLQNMKSILLSASVAKKLFGDTDPVNQTVTMDAKWDLHVTGVYEDLPKNSEFSEASYFAPLDLYLDGWATLDSWDNYHMYIYVQLHEGGDFTTISAAIKDAMNAHVPRDVVESNPQVFLLPMSQLHLHSQFENGIPVTSERMKFVWFYGIIGAFVLILACINFMNLSTARSEKRAREVGIRKSIGSVRSQLVYQFLGESLLTAMLAFVLSLLLVALALPWFNDIAGKSIVLPWRNPVFWVAGIAFTMFTGLLAGSYPALYLSSFNPVKVLKGTFKAGRYAGLPRRILVVVQFSVSITMVFGTVIVYQQIQFVKDRPVGYSRDRLIELRPRAPEYFGKYDALRTELKNTGVVEEMAEANYSVMSSRGWNPGFEWQGKTGGEGPSFNTIRVTYEYGETVGWEFVEGRDFSRDNPGDLQGVVLNESALKIMGLERPVGEKLTWRPGGKDQGTYEIIGVVKDMVKESPYDKTYPSIIFLSDKDQEWLYIKLRSDVRTADALQRIQTTFSTIVPSAPFDFAFVDEAYNAKFRAEERIGKLAGIFSFLAILISCSGLFGLASFMAEQRTKEISIRKVLGASVSQLWILMSKEFIALVVVACLLATPLSSSFMEKWLAQYTYRTSLGWPVFVVVIGGAFVITLMTVSFQALKTALRNPVDSLKTE